MMRRPPSLATLGEIVIGRMIGAPDHGAMARATTMAMYGKVSKRGKKKKRSRKNVATSKSNMDPMGAAIRLS